MFHDTGKNMYRKFLFIVIGWSLLGGGVIYCRDSRVLEPSVSTIKIPVGGCFKLSKEEFCEFLQKEPVWANGFPDNFSLETVLNDFRNGTVDFYSLFLSQKEILKTQAKGEKLSQQNNLLGLYEVLWQFQDKEKHIRVSEYLDRLNSIERIRTIGSILVIWGSDYFDPRIYPLFVKSP